MTKRGGIVRAIIEANRRKPWGKGPNGHWTSLIMTCLLSALTMIWAIRQHELRLLAVTLIMAAVIFLICETAFYLSSPLTMTERQSGSTQQNRTVEPRSMPVQRKQ